VLNEYITDRAQRDPVNGRNAGHRLRKHAISNKKFASVRLDRLRASDILNWRAGLPADLAPSTTNRMLNDVRAAINTHIEMNWRTLPASLKMELQVGARGLPNTQRARHALLSDTDIRRVVEGAYAVDEDLGDLVLILGATGARFRQVSQITVADAQVGANPRVLVPVSRKGQGVKQRQHVPVPIGVDVANRLKGLIAGRAEHEPLLKHWVGVKGFGHAEGPVRREGWRSANQMFKGWVRALAAAGVEYREPYALRHSSIVRAIRAGVPARIVAAAHDTSTNMIERNYAAHILDIADELTRRAIVPLTSPQPAPLRAVSG
jgi:integrase